QATEILASLMRRLWRPLPEGHTLPSVASWAEGLGRLRATFRGTTGPFPEALVARAEQTFDELLATAGPPLLLHGDLHHLNVLTAEREPWLAIDPKGLAGDPGYDVAAMLHNPSRTLRATGNLAALLERRIAIMSAITEQPRRRLAMWGFALAVLSAWWTYEDHGHVGDEALYHAELMLPLLQRG
ncbi:MAG TPA: aminoglycoside phosphotransferase family protein, partial [Roseiflexaceae bacterium]|nr:aminoglycoside phosphotransferase family protein [Roseiflexaceae bacterium]